MAMDLASVFQRILLPLLIRLYVNKVAVWWWMSGIGRRSLMNGQLQVETEN